MAGHRRVVLASGNRGKLREIRELLADLPVEVVTQAELAVAEVEETGSTFVENAIIKARNAARATGLPALADDSGLEVDVLGGEPGIRSSRYAGEDATDEQNLLLLLERIAAAGATNPAARFQCAMVLLRSEKDPTPLIAQGTWEGHIVAKPRGSNGFGYDPVFHVPTHGCTSAELPAEVKNSISHRARAMLALQTGMAGWLAAAPEVPAR